MVISHSHAILIEVAMHLTALFHVISRYASYAIVADLCVNDHERIQQAQLYASTGILPKALQLIGAARLTCAQGIHRAENLAVLKCFEARREAVILPGSCRR